MKKTSIFFLAALQIYFDRLKYLAYNSLKYQESLLSDEVCHLDTMTLNEICDRVKCMQKIQTKLVKEIIVENI